MTAISAKIYINKLRLHAGMETKQSSRKPEARRYNIIGNIILLVIAIAIFFGVLEIVARTLIPVSDVLYVSDSEIGHKHIPNKTGIFVIPDHVSKVSFNSEGFRDIQHDVANTLNNTRIVFLGDSFVDGMEVDFQDTFHQILSKQLEQQNPGKYEILNFGMSMFGTGQEMKVFETYAQKYNPNIVILFFFPGNDVTDNSNTDPNEPGFYLENGEIKERAFVEKKYSPLSYFIADHFKSTVFIRNEILTAQGIINSKKDLALIIPEIYKKEYSTKTKQEWQLTIAILQKIAKDTKESGARFILVEVPDKLQMDKKYRDNAFALYPNVSEDGYDFVKPSSIVEDFCKTENISCLQLYKKFQEGAKIGIHPAAYYYVHDGHWNSLGNKAVADQLKSYLATIGID